MNLSCRHLKIGLQDWLGIPMEEWVLRHPGQVVLTVVSDSGLDSNDYTFTAYVKGFHCCIYKRVSISLQWRHNERDGISNQQPHDCLLNRFRRRSKKTSKLHVTGPLCGEFTGDRWIPRTKGQKRGKCFLLIRSSCKTVQHSIISCAAQQWQKIQDRLWTHRNPIAPVHLIFIVRIPIPGKMVFVMKHIPLSVCSPRSSSTRRWWPVSSPQTL